MLLIPCIRTEVDCEHYTDIRKQRTASIHLRALETKEFDENGLAKTRTKNKALTSNNKCFHVQYINFNRLVSFINEKATKTKKPNRKKPAAVWLSSGGFDSADRERTLRQLGCRGGSQFTCCSALRAHSQFAKREI